MIALKAPLLLGNSSEQAFLLIPEIHSVDIPSRYNSSPNTSFVKDTKGVIYIAKENGILTLDGNRMFFSAVEYPLFLAGDDSTGIIYLTTDDFGYLTYEPLKEPVRNSLLSEIRSNFHSFLPYNITLFDDAVFLATSEGVIHIKNKKVTHFFFNRNSRELYNSGNTLFLKMDNGDLFRWNDGEFVKEIDHRTMGRNAFSSIVDWQGLVLLCSEGGESRAYDIHIKDFTSLPRVLVDKKLKLISRVRDELYLVKDLEERLLLISPGDENPLSLPFSQHFSTQVPVSVYSDQFKDIWILFEFGLKKVEYPSTSYMMDLSNLETGPILSTAILNGELYIAASRGLYKIFSEDRKAWVAKKISEPKHGFFSEICTDDHYLVAGGNSGLYQVKGDSLFNIDYGQFSYLSFYKDHTLLAAGVRGLVKFVRKGDNWEKSALTSSPVRVISSVHSDSAFFMLLDNQVLLQLEENQPISHRLENINLNSFSNLVILDGELILIQEDQYLQWDPGKKIFEKGGKNLAGQIHKSRLIVNSDMHQWSIFQGASGRNTLWLLTDNHIDIPYFEIPATRDFGQVVDIDENERDIWITGDQKLLRLDQQPELISNEDLLRIQSVLLTELRHKDKKHFIQNNDHLKYKRFTARFTLSDIRYQNDPSPYYRFKISRFQEEWSEWQRDPVIEIGPLTEHSYNFEAQSASAFGQLSESVTYNFTIAPPFYRRWYAYLFYALSIAAASFLFYKWRLLTIKKVELTVEEKIKERMATVLSEKAKSDKLVADLFPKGTFEELKNQGRAKSKKFEMATVLFSDIQGFTKIAEEMNPELLIDELDKFFFHFDSVVEKYNIEKIKTIGDAYMAAGGIPVKNRSNPIEVVLAGLEMQYYMKDLKRKKTDIWDLRIGIHTGPVISGVVGHKKLSYDIWGDTVNTASRMESSGEGGKVNISGTTYSYVKEFFICEYRGKLPVKYKGNIDMYFVTGLRPELSVDLQGVPNKNFFVKLQLVRLQDLEERVWDEITKNQELNLHFHKLEYLQSVMNQAEILGRAENVSDEDMLIVKSAALLMYVGLSETYEKFENKSVELARKILPEYAYDEKQIDRIVNLILAAKSPYNPQNQLESILIDAKMEYLGRSDYNTQAKLRYLEEKNLLKGITKETFINKEVHKLKNFKYFSIAAQRLREIPAEEQIAKLEAWK